MGIIPTRSGLARAKKSLLSPLGLAWRLQRNVLLGWAIGIAALGATFGLVAVEFKDFFTSNENLQALLGAAGGGGNFTDIFFVAVMSYTALMMAGYGLQAVLRLQSEEASGHVEPILATATGRTKWALSHVGVVVGGVILLGAFAGFITGLSYILSAGAEWSELGRLTVAGLVQAPAVLVFVGLAVALFGLFHRFSTAVAWAVFVVCLALSMLGALLKLPEWAINLSPFANTPAAPASNIDAAPLIIMSAIALVLGIIGLSAFRRRNLDI